MEGREAAVIGCVHVRATLEEKPGRGNVPEFHSLMQRGLLACSGRIDIRAILYKKANNVGMMPEHCPMEGCPISTHAGPAGIRPNAGMK
jgi:hypothetical protein